MPRFDLILFDYDGTLCDTRAAVAHCCRFAFQAHGCMVPSESAIARAIGAGGTLEVIFAQLDPSLTGDPLRLSAMVETYRTEYRTNGARLQTLFAGVADTLKALHGAAALAVVSSKGEDAVQAAFGTFGLTDLFVAIIADRPGLPAKPDPAVFKQRIVPQFPSVARSRIVMVGDTEADLQFAHACGMASCWARYGYGNAARCLALEPVFTIGHFGELSTIVLGAGRSAPAGLTGGPA